MKNFKFFLLISLFSVGAYAQTAVSRETAAERTALAHRRAELRLALKASQQEAQDQDQDQYQSFENVSADRHLSAQERADLRQQLRPPRRDINPERP